MIRSATVPRISVVVPTRERSETLLYTLRTCVAQEYENLEIIVSDNFSADGTRDVVESFSDPRVRYVNTGRRLAMSDNFEFGYSHVTGDFVLYIGDDDGLLPGAVAAGADLLSKSGVKALGWNNLQYIWPTEGADGLLQVPFDEGLYSYTTKKALREAFVFVAGRLWFPWTRLPVVMKSFVDRTVLDALKARSGRLFWSSQPDVYSGFAIAAEIQNYLYSLRPFTVNGGSKHSQGRASSADGDKGRVADAFARENAGSESMSDGKLHVRGSIVSCVLEAAHYANKYAAGGRFRINYEKFLRVAAEELAAAAPEVYENGMVAIVDVARTFAGQEWDRRTLSRRHPNHPVDRDRFEYGLTRKGALSLNPRVLGLDDVASATSFASKLLPAYPRYDKPRQYKSYGRVAGQVYQFVSSRTPDKAL